MKSPNCFLEKKSFASFITYAKALYPSYHPHCRKKMIVQDHVMKFRTLTEFDSQFLLRNINHTMLLDLLDLGTLYAFYLTYQLSLLPPSQRRNRLHS